MLSKCTKYYVHVAKIGKRRIKLSLSADRHSKSGLSLQWCHIPRGEKWRTPGCGSYSVPPGIFIPVQLKRELWGSAEFAVPGVKLPLGSATKGTCTGLINTMPDSKITSYYPKRKPDSRRDGLAEWYLCPVPFVPHLGPLVGLFHEAGRTSGERTGAPEPPRLLPCEIQPAKERKSTPPGHFLHLNVLAVGDTAVCLRKECSSVLIVQGLTLASLVPLSRYAALRLHGSCIGAINNWMIRAYQRCSLALSFHNKLGESV
ncbi:hypothetical protein PCH_Pc20g13870 [Penicillium rubens Wisconsin 54-1255]|uniref:Uncharacterized protein n=1 Tax=Penicillium rubens (strain ATCC 28089 / DSM 1075 / NRRL 1951 / Wisconsin 54-1255) TaxID=500485 RepID=B6HH24_PENRW|nr:hypothetical protein PCH_Pc20g13870 [Penicillium rubens Wisconsin 54-1255]